MLGIRKIFVVIKFNPKLNQILPFTTPNNAMLPYNMPPKGIIAAVHA